MLLKPRDGNRAAAGVYIEDINHGIIMKSPNGNCWRGRVNNQGQLEFVLLPDCLTTSVSNSKNETKSGIKVHPNPADGYIQFTCSLDDLSNYTSYSILDTRGNLVRKAGLVHVVTIVDTRELPAGTYFIHFEGNQAFWTEKVVIK